MTDVEVRVFFTPRRIARAAGIILKNKLHLKDGLLECNMRWARTSRFVRSAVKRIAGLGLRACFIAYGTDGPVACAIVQRHVIMLYVKPEYRRQGIATALYAQAMKSLHRKWHFRAFVNDSTRSYGFFKTVVKVVPGKLPKCWAWGDDNPPDEDDLEE